MAVILTLSCRSFVKCHEIDKLLLCVWDAPPCRLLVDLCQLAMCFDLTVLFVIDLANGGTEGKN